MGLLDGVKAKLDRADGLIGELRRQTEPLAVSATRSIRQDSEGDGSKLIFRVMDVPPLGPDVAPLVGDILHNVRSALDHLAWQLVLFDGGQPTCKTTFPIFTKAPKQPITIKPGINDTTILAVLKAVQPFTEATYGHDPNDSALALVRALNNYDKHRLLLAVVCSIDHRLPAYWGSNKGDPEPSYEFTTGPLGPGAVVAWFDFGGRPAPTSFDPTFQLAVSLWAPEARWLVGMNIADGLEGLSHSVRRQINYGASTHGGFAEAIGEHPI